jgi:O-methyltransferase involved in polyketide biosynthesis
VSASLPTIFEVDVPSALTDKRAVSEKLLPNGDSAQVAWVPCDFEHDELRERLLSSGFDSHRPSVIVWIGVSPYSPAKRWLQRLPIWRNYVRPAASSSCDPAFMHGMTLTATG